MKDNKSSYRARWGHERQESNVYHTSSGRRSMTRREVALKNLDNQLNSGLKPEKYETAISGWHTTDKMIPLEVKDITRIKKEMSILINRGTRLITA